MASTAAPIWLPRLPRPASHAALAIGWTASLIAVVTAAGVLWYAAELTQGYLHEVGGWCGTGRYWAWSQLTSTVPLALAFPVGASLISWWVAHGLSLARCAATAASLGWLICLATVHGYGLWW